MYGSGSFSTQPFALRSMRLPKSNPPNMPEAKRSRAKTGMWVLAELELVKFHEISDSGEAWVCEIRSALFEGSVAF